MQKIEITIPDGCEVQIVRKEEKKEPVIRTYQELVQVSHRVGVLPNTKGELKYVYAPIGQDCPALAKSMKVAKSMLAMAQISQLMPYYGGEITDEEWYNINLLKHCITCRNNRVYKEGLGQLRVFLAFHTSKQRDEFLEYNEQLVKEYLMID